MYVLTQGMLWLVIEIILKDTESHTVLGRRKMDCQHPWTSDRTGRQSACSYDPQLLFRVGPPEGKG